MGQDTLVRRIDWTHLRHSNGVASDIPALLGKLGTARGSEFDDTLGALFRRIWQDGTLYSASGPATGGLTALLDSTPNPERTSLFEVLAALTESAREAVLSPPDRPCAAGSRADGLTVMRNIRAARSRFKAGMTDESKLSRRLSARLFVACDEPESAAELRDLYSRATDTRVRRELLAGLLRLSESVPDWPQFIRSTLEEEKDPESRFLLRSSEIWITRDDASAECVTDLVNMFLVANAGQTAEPSLADLCGDPEQLVRTLRTLSERRQIEALIDALQGVQDDNLALLMAERLVRIAFHDQRANWGDASLRLVNPDQSEIQPDPPILIILRSLARIFLWRVVPQLRNRWPRGRPNPQTVSYVEYTNLEGEPPIIPRSLNVHQRMVLKAIAECPSVWRVYTNLWDVFTLPKTAGAMRLLAVL